MRPSTKRDVGMVLSDLVRQILLSPLDFQGADDIAAKCGYSRFHLTRLFQAFCGEGLTAFHRRIRLERSAFELSKGASVHEASLGAGFDSPESFTRAFRRSYGVPPRDFLSSGSNWRLPSAEGLHWNEHWGDPSGFELLSRRYETRLERAKPLRLAVVRHVGNYAKLSLGWETVPYHLGKRWFTIYHDSIWTCPHSDMMRADLGFELQEGQPPPGFTVVEIPSGLTVKTVRFVERDNRHEAWSYLTGVWRNGIWSYDEYLEWPLPFDQVKTKVCITLGS